MLLHCAVLRCATCSAVPDGVVTTGERDIPLLRYVLLAKSWLACRHQGARPACQPPATLTTPCGHLQGSYGRVFLARLHETPCAVKVLLSWQEDGGGGGNGNLGGGNGGGPGDDAAVNGASMLAREQRQTLTLASPLLADLRREAGVMAALHHPNCVQLMGICAEPAAIVTGVCACSCLAAAFALCL